MDYYDRYFRKYKEIMYPVIEWKNELSKKDKRDLNGQLIWRICVVIIEIIGHLMLYMFLKKSILGLLGISVIYVSLFWITVTAFCRSLDNRVNQYQQKVASKYDKEDFEQLIGAKRQSYIDFLRNEGITEREQYKILISGVEAEIKKRKPKNIINYGIMGAAILPLWNTAIGALYANTGIINATTISICCIVILVYGLIIFRTCTGIKNEVFYIINNEIYRLQEMKDILLDLELKSLATR